MTGSPAATDQLIGIGDGNTSSFPLIKSYGDGAEPQVRPISRPRIETLSVSINGVETSDWTYDPSSGVAFSTAPPVDSEIRSGFLFDVPVRFAEDRLDITGVNFAAGEAPSVPLIEIRETP